MEKIVFNWNLNKSEKQIKEVNSLIENNVDENGIFKVRHPQFEIELKKIGFSWASNENEVNNFLLDKVYSEILNIFKKYNLRMLPHAGTLLGFVRDKGSIAHDDDYDVSIDYKDLSLNFNEIAFELEKMNLEFYWNSEIICEGINEKWLPWTKIISKNNFELIIGNYKFEFIHAIDLFPIIQFDNFDQYFEILETYINIYEYNIKYNGLFKEYAIKYESRRKMLIDSYGIENYEKILDMIKSKKFLKSSDEKLKINFAKLNSLLKREGKYYITLCPNVFLKVWRNTEENPKNIVLKNKLEYYSTSIDIDDVQMFYGNDWKINPKVGPLHSLDSWSFKGKV